MKLLHYLFLLLFLKLSFILQAQDKGSDSVSFITIIDIKKATKNGIFLNEYVVNIPYHKLLRLNGKKVCISGKVTIEKGLSNYHDGVARQGREKDTKHILRPKMVIVGD